MLSITTQNINGTAIHVSAENALKIDLNILWQFCFRVAMINKISE